ncbi:hypothetical protein [Mycobacterium asiaticum]|nr:hypothetical protein [Mycobacterium asiaticum]
MWIIEINVAGYRYTRELPTYRRRLRFHRRQVVTPSPQPGHVPAA